MAILGKMLGVDQQKALAELKTTLAEYLTTHKLKFKLLLVDNALEGEAWLEEKEKT